MSSVRIVVEDRVLGDVEVNLDYPSSLFDLDAARTSITFLLENATAKIYRAYQIPTGQEDE